MTSRPMAQPFSLIRLLGRHTAPMRGLQFGASHQPRPPAPPIDPQDHAAIAERLARLLPRLEAARTAHLAASERTLRLALPASLLPGILWGWVQLGNPVLGLALMAGGAGFVLLWLTGRANEAPRKPARDVVLAVVADRLTDLVPDPAPALTPAGLAALRLFPPIREVTVDLRLTGQRAGRAVAVWRIGIDFGTEATRRVRQGKGLAFVLVEIALPGPEAPSGPDARPDHTVPSGHTVIVPTDAPLQLRGAPQGHGLAAAATGDAAFDARYIVHGVPSPVTPALRAAFPAIEAQARCAPHGLAQIAPGTGLRPWVVIRPGALSVLTPLSMFDGAFQPPPLWQPLNADALIPGFAADLSRLTAHLDAALSLPIKDLS